MGKGGCRGCRAKAGPSRRLYGRKPAIEPVDSGAGPSQSFTAAEQFVIDLADFIQELLCLGVGGQALAGLVDLILGFEQERLDLSFGKAAVEIEEGTVFGATGVAVAVGFTAFEEAFEQRGVKEVGRRFEGTQEMSLALAQSQSRGAFECACPTHIYT